MNRFIHDIYERYEGIIFSLFISFIICIIINLLSSCSKRTTNIQESEDVTHHATVSEVSSVSTQSKKDIQTYWQATTEEYSQPDSTGKQYILKVIRTSGGTVQHDTIFIQSNNIIDAEVHDSIVYRYRNKETVEPQTTKISYCFTLVLSISIFCIICIIYNVYRKKTNRL